MKDSTQIVIVLDRSGSMESARESTVSGLNTFIAKQKESNRDINLKIVQFDEVGGGLSYETTYQGFLRNAPLFTQADFKPRGGTPLLDAQGKAITELGEELALMQESLRPSRVIFVTITDGYENASKNYTANKIKDMIQHQTSKYNWDFVYLGANQDAVAVGQSYGIIGGKSMTYNVINAQAVGATYSNLAAYVTRGSVCDPSQIQHNNFLTEERDSSLTGSAGTTSLAGVGIPATEAEENAVSGKNI